MQSLFGQQLVAYGEALQTDHCRLDRLLIEAFQAVMQVHGTARRSLRAEGPRPLFPCSALSACSFGHAASLAT